MYVGHSLCILISVQIRSPWVILNDFGGAFAMGAVGGGIWHGIKGARNSPRVCYFPFLYFSLVTPKHLPRHIG